MQRIPVVVALRDQSKGRRLAGDLSREPGIETVAATTNLMQTFTAVEELTPRAVLIDERMTIAPEFEVMRGLFAAMDVRWLVLAGPARAASEGLAPAASDLFHLPQTTTAATLAGQLRSLTRSARQRVPRARSDAVAEQATSDRVILIGASTGGVDALLKVLSAFPATCPPTLIVQHTGYGFGDSLARLLDRQCKARVSLVDGPAQPGPGDVMLAAGTGAHLVITTVDPLEVTLETGKPVSGNTPSVDRLFDSATPLADRTVAALLTGMGHDGAEGLLALREAGGRTIAQDAATSVVHGMPGSAIARHAACDVLPIQEIGPSLIAHAVAPARPSRRTMA